MGQVDRFSITTEPALGEKVRHSAAKSGASISSRLSKASRQRLLRERLGEALDAWEAEIGPPADEDLAGARAKLAAARITGGENFQA